MGYPMQTLPGPRSEPMKPDGNMAQRIFQARAKLALLLVQLNEYSPTNRVRLRAKILARKRTIRHSYPWNTHREKSQLTTSIPQASAGRIRALKLTANEPKTTRHKAAQSYGANSTSTPATRTLAALPNTNKPNGLLRGI